MHKVLLTVSGKTLLSVLGKETGYLGDQEMKVKVFGFL